MTGDETERRGGYAVTMLTHLPCIGGPFDGSSWPVHERDQEVCIPNFNLRHREAFGAMKTEVLSADSSVGEAVARHAADVAGGTNNVSLYRVIGDALCYLRELTVEEYREWKVAQREADGQED